MEPIYFSSPEKFRKWLESNHTTASELLVGYYKVGTGKPSMTWSESVDQALCFGWIDGIGRSVDEERYTIRFTPRSPKSNWSAINIKKVQVLTEQGLMMPAGLAVYEGRPKDESAYRYENWSDRMAPELEKIFEANQPAWNFFNKQAPSYRRMMCFWVMDAKKEGTKMSRLKKLMEASEIGKRMR